MNGAVSKTVVGRKVHRGFESLPLRLRGEKCRVSRHFSLAFQAVSWPPVDPSRPRSTPHFWVLVQRTCSAPSRGTPSDGPFEVGVEEACGLLLRAREEVAVPVQSDRY